MKELQTAVEVEYGKMVHVGGETADSDAVNEIRKRMELSK